MQQHTDRASHPASYNPIVAAQEGWGVIERGVHCDGRPRIELSRFDQPVDGQVPFAADRDAWMWVVSKARAGSLLHRSALDRVDAIERAWIEIACGAW